MAHIDSGVPQLPQTYSEVFAYIKVEVKSDNFFQIENLCMTLTSNTALPIDPSSN